MKKGNAKKVGVGLIGCGTVGSAVVEFIFSQRDEIRKRDGVDIELKKIYTRTPSGLKSKHIFELYPHLFTSKCSDVIFDEDIDIIIETVGGIDFAYSLARKALRARKHLVTANKAMLAYHGESLFRLAAQNNIGIGFEASVAGAIPIIRVLSDSLIGGQVISICGILNGTSNFILTKMAQEKLSYDKVLKQAKELGFAEQDPSEDVNGQDARNKIVVLAQLAFGFNLDPKDIYTEGITNIITEDFEYAEEKLNSTIKLIAFCDKEGSMYVCPMLIPKNSFLASVNNEFNGINVLGYNFQELGFTGLGAGGKATASSIVADIINIAINKNKPHETVFHVNKKVQDFNDLIFQHTLRFVVKDQVGIIRDIACVLAEHNISINAVKQNDYGIQRKDALPFLITLNSAREGDVQKAVAKINEFEFLVKPAMVFRSFV